MKYTLPFKSKISLTSDQWQQARRMWDNGKDTHDIACVLGCTEAHVYNRIYLLKNKDAA